MWKTMPSCLQCGGEWRRSPDQWTGMMQASGPHCVEMESIHMLLSVRANSLPSELHVSARLRPALTEGNARKWRLRLVSRLRWPPALGPFLLQDAFDMRA